MQEMWVQFLGWEDPSEKEIATHSSVPAWEILWTEEPGGLRVVVVGGGVVTKVSDATQWLNNNNNKIAVD